MPDVDNAFEVEDGIIVGNVEEGQAGVFGYLTTPTFTSYNGSITLTPTGIWTRRNGVWTKLTDSPEGFRTRSWYRQRLTNFFTTARLFVPVPSTNIVADSGDLVATVINNIQISKNNTTVYTAIRDNGTVLTDTINSKFIDTKNKPYTVTTMYGWTTAGIGNIEIVVYASKGTLKVNSAKLLLQGAAIL